MAILRNSASSAAAPAWAAAALAAFGCWAAPAAPQQPTVPPDLATAQDCLEIALQAGDDPTLTRAERIAALDKALLESLSRTDLCGAVGVGNEAGNGAGVIGGGAPGNVPGVDAPAGGSKVPDDIPPAANDDIIAQQLRQAAVDEQDPATRAKLWNEYRRYNNLPVKDIPESAGNAGGDGAN